MGKIQEAPYFPTIRPANKKAPKRGLFCWLGDVDSNHGKQSQSLLSYR